MRTYKFRGKRADNNQWIYGGISIFKGEFEMFDSASVDNGCYEVIKESIGQFTGYQDGSGYDIYEGDVIKYWGGSLVVKFETFDDNQGYILPLDDMDMEIIGNIYDSPELDNQTIVK
jgi:hypothetical protein